MCLMLAWVATSPTLGGVFIIALRFLKGAHIEELGMVEGFIFGMISGFQPPRPLKSLPPPPPLITEDYPMVSSLIDLNTRWWKIDSVRALFLPVNADAILKIPLSLNLPEDRIIWIGNNKGEYSVKSAYFIAVNLLEFV